MTLALGAALAVLTLAVTPQSPEGRPLLAAVAPGATDTVHVAAPTGERDADRTSIRAALDLVQEGGTVQFAAGTYLIGEMISVTTPRVTLLGHPEGTTLRGCHPEDVAGMQTSTESCNGLELAGARQTVRGFTFEHAFWALHLGCCYNERATYDFPDGSTHELPVVRRGEGGHRVEGNTFRSASSGIRVNGGWTEPSIVRDNRFIDNWHAISINGHTVHVVDNHFSVPEPERVPDYGFAWDAIKIAPPMPIQGETGPPECIGNVIVGNTIEGYLDGIRLEVYLPGSICRENVIRDNTITVRRAHNPSPSDPSDPTMIGTPIALLNDPIFSEYAGSDAPTFVEENIVEGNRIVGAEGLGIEVLRASRNRIANNIIERVVAREPFPGNTRPGASDAWRHANGSGIWISRGSDGNDLVANTFLDVAAHAVVLEGDSNRVQLPGAGEAVRDLGSGNRVNGLAAAEWVDPSPHTVRFVTVAPDVRIEVLDWGGTGEPLVLLAGMMATAHTFDEFAPGLTDAFRVLAITRRGFGASSQPETGYDMTSLVNDVRSVLDTLGIERAAFVGHSFGAQEIMRFARLWPERVSHVVNLDGMLVADIGNFIDVMSEVPTWPPPGDAEHASVAAFSDYLTRVVYGVRLPEAEIRARWRVGSDGRVGEEATPPWIGAAIIQGTDPTPVDDLRVPLLSLRNVTTSAAALIPWYDALAPEDRDRADRAFPALQRLWADGWAPFAGMRSARIVDFVDASHTIYISHEREVMVALREFLLAPVGRPNNGR